MTCCRLVPGLVASAGIATIVVLTRPSTFGLEALDHGFADGARRTAHGAKRSKRSEIGEFPRGPPGRHHGSTAMLLNGIGRPACLRRAGEQGSDPGGDPLCEGDGFGLDQRRVVVERGDVVAAFQRETLDRALHVFGDVVTVTDGHHVILG